MSLIHRRQRHALLMILVYLAGILAACDEQPAPAQCYIYDFRAEPQTSDGDPINIIAGEWIPGLGIQTVDNEIVANWQEPFYFLPQAIHISVLRPDGVTGDIQIAALADAFGRNVNDAFTLPSDVDEGTGRVEWEFPLPGSPILEGNTFNGVIQTDQPIVVTQITIVPRSDEPSPYPVNSCDVEFPTPTPSISETPTATVTGTPGCATRTYVASTTDGLWIPDPPENLIGVIGTLNAPRFYFVNNGTATVTLTNPGYVNQVKVTWGRLYSDAFPGSLVEVYAQPGNILLVDRDFDDNEGQTFTIPQTDTIPISTTNITHIEFVYSGFTGNAFGPVNFEIFCAPATPTPGPTATGTNTPTRTAIPSPQTPTLTLTQPGVFTSTPQFTNTPRNTITPTFTPSNTFVLPPTPPPPPTIPPPITNTRVPLPTPRYTATYWPTYPGPALTPIPGGTANFGTVIQTPIIGTLASTPYRDATSLPVPDDLGEHQDGVIEYLETAVGYINELPRDIGGIAPGISDTFPTFAGYAKWSMSSVSLQEIFGQQIYPIPQHAFYGFAVIMVVSTITIIFKIALFFVKLALWVIRFILKIIPFIG